MESDASYAPTKLLSFQNNMLLPSAGYENKLINLPLKGG